MKYKVKFYNPTQVFIIKADHYKDILENFEELNSEFYTQDIRNYGRIIKANVYDCNDNIIDRIKITKQ